MQDQPITTPHLVLNARNMSGHRDESGVAGEATLCGHPHIQHPSIELGKTRQE